MRRIVALVAFLCASSAVQVAAEQPRRTLVWSNAVVGRYNPLGLVNSTEGQYQFRLYESDSAVLATNYVGLGFNPKLTPAFGRFGPKLEIMPMSILALGPRG